MDSLYLLSAPLSVCPLFVFSFFPFDLLFPCVRFHQSADFLSLCPFARPKVSAVDIVVKGGSSKVWFLACCVNFYLVFQSEQVRRFRSTLVLLTVGAIDLHGDSLGIRPSLIEGFGVDRPARDARRQQDAMVVGRAAMELQGLDAVATQSAAIEVEIS